MINNASYVSVFFCLLKKEFCSTTMKYHSSGSSKVSEMVSRLGLCTVQHGAAWQCKQEL